MISALLLAVSVMAAAPQAEVEAPAFDRYFRGVFRHEGKTKSVQISYRALSNVAEFAVDKIDVRVEQGCFVYRASGYVKDSRMVLLPVSVYLGSKIDPEILKALPKESLITFDIASLVCRLDEKRDIASVDIVMPDLTIYHVKSDLKTPSAP